MGMVSPQIGIAAEFANGEIWGKVWMIKSGERSGWEETMRWASDIEPEDGNWEELSRGRTYYDAKIQDKKGAAARSS